MNWILSNYQTILIAVSGVVAGASVMLHAIAPLTKSTKDDSWMAKVDWLLAKLSLNKSGK